jgi:hypothetical protein
VTTDRERFVMTFEALPDATPTAARVKALLKRALRSFRLRCLSVAPTPQSHARDPDQDRKGPHP